MLVLRFLMVLFSFNLIEQYHSMQIKVCRYRPYELTILITFNVSNQHQCNLINFQHETLKKNLDLENMDLGWLPPLLIGLNTPKNSDFLKMLLQNLTKKSSPR